jgi:hypothetical protein
MESSQPKRRFPPPWRVEKDGEDCFRVVDDNGISLASVYCRDDLQRWSFSQQHLTSDEARRIAKAIARLPEFLMPDMASIHAAMAIHDGERSAHIMWR